MPNFICQNVRELNLPFERDGVRFCYEVASGNERLVACECGGEEFFIIIKTRQMEQKNKTTKGTKSNLKREKNESSGREVLDVLQNETQNETKKNEKTALLCQDEKANLSSTQNTQASFTVKADKLSRPSSLALLQKTLEVFKNEFCSGIVSQAYAVKPSKEAKKLPFVFGENEIETLFEMCRTNYEKVFVEVGFGSGRHLLFQAAQNPKTLVIGLEVYVPALEQVSNLAVAKGLKNVALFGVDARLFLAMTPSNLVERIFLHFPVPWLKSEKRRVVSADFVRECERVLALGGRFELRTDEREYAEFTTQKLLDLASADVQIYKNRALSVTSKYEARWTKQQKDIYDVIFSCGAVSAEVFSGVAGGGECAFEFGRVEFDGGGGGVCGSNVCGERAFFRGEDFFVHFERAFGDGFCGDSNLSCGGFDKFDKCKRVLLRVSFGGFYRPEHVYILLERGFEGENGGESKKWHAKYLKTPLKTAENFKAHAKICEILKDEFIIKS